MVTGGDSSLVVDSMSPSGRVGSTAVPPSPPRTNALFSLTRFRNRLGTEMNEIIPNLFLGSLRDATDVEQLKKNRIQYVVSVHDLSARHPAHEHLKVLRIQLSDCSSSDISSHFAATNQFIHAARLKQAAVLVHCLAGVSRSATVVAAYLITVCDLSFLNALSLISRKRPVINPNFGFRMQLCSFADRCAVAERLRLREHFGASIFDAQWVADKAVTRSKIDWDSMGLDASQSCVATLPLSETGSACGPVTVTPVGDQSTSTGPTAIPGVSPLPLGMETTTTTIVPSSAVSLPIRKIVARALPLPQSHRVQVLTIAHNPVLSEAGFIDE
ncbi:hypothetical protein Q1695_014749 [Nippostrongylus brasiliensis]|nr:hypothetical protein Q1695_014749 [Nippostrongylus brasiliensis]